MKIEANPTSRIKLNIAQLRFIMWLGKYATSIWGRGTGKSYIIAYLIHMIVKHMPRSTWGIVGRTFAQMLEITLLPTFYALEHFGYIMDVDYFVRKKPPEMAKFDKALKPPAKYEYTITFYNGTTFQLVTQDRSSRGSDLQGVICDESLNLNKERFDQEIVPAIRGFKQEFGHVPFYRGQYHFTSMPDISGGKWLLDHSSYYNDDGYDFEILTKKLIKLQLALIDCNDNKLRRELWPEIKAIRKKIKFYRSKQGMFYSEANAFDNIDNLGIGYLIDMRKNMMDLTFRVEVLNEKVASILNGFYANLDEHHLYDLYDYSHIDSLILNKASFEKKDSRFDKDVDKHRPLHLGIDLGMHINVAAVAQNLHSEIRFLNDFYAKSPMLLKHMIKDFTEYYKPHQKRVVKISFDTSSSSQQQYSSNKTLIDQVADDLKKDDWFVEILTKGRKLTHQERYDLVNEMYLQDNIHETKRKYPVLRYHRYNCHNLLMALGNTGIKRGRNTFEKDKSGERNMSADQLREPHLTDAHDYIIDDLLKDQYKKKNMAGLGELHT
jgi:hypothetical protein